MASGSEDCLLVRGNENLVPNNLDLPRKLPQLTDVQAAVDEVLLNQCSLTAVKIPERGDAFIFFDYANQLNQPIAF